jgi:transposase-like protein
MEDFPKTLIEFRERFATEEACLDFITSMRWPGGFVCPKCHTQEVRRTTRGLFECRKCRHQTSVTAGTLFHGTRKPLRLWFEAMWHITNQKYGANALGLQRVLNLGSYNTAWQWLHRLRRAMVRPGRNNLSGTIEVDETLVGGKRSGKRGRGAESKSLVVIAVEDKSEVSKTGKGIGRIRLQHIPNASADTLSEFINNHICVGSRVRTDGWSGYQPISTMGYKHIVVGSKDLVIAHLVASLLKRWLLGTYQGAVQPHHLNCYLDEFTFRFNRRASATRGKLFYRLVQYTVLAEPVPRYEIFGGIESPEVIEAEALVELNDVPF